MGKLLGTGIWGLENKFLLEGVSISIQGSAGEFDVGAGGDDMVVSCLELFVFGKVLSEKDWEVIIQPFASCIELTLGSKEKDTAGVLRWLDLHTPVRVHEDFPNGAKFFFVVSNFGRDSVIEDPVVKALERDCGEGSQIGTVVMD